MSAQFGWIIILAWYVAMMMITIMLPESEIARSLMVELGLWL